MGEKLGKWGGKVPSEGKCANPTLRSGQFMLTCHLPLLVLRIDGRRVYKAHRHFLTQRHRELRRLVLKIRERRGSRCDRVSEVLVSGQDSGKIIRALTLTIALTQRRHSTRVKGSVESPQG